MPQNRAILLLCFEQQENFALQDSSALGVKTGNADLELSSHNFH